MQARQAGAAQAFHVQQHGGDLVVLGRLVQRGKHVAQAGLARRAAALDLRHQLLACAAGELLDEIAVQLDHQRRLLGQRLGATRQQCRHDDDEQQQHEEIRQRPARAVEQPPGLGKEPADCGEQGLHRQRP